jgi:hypothetical protein
MFPDETTCPYRVGDIVVYRPSERGLGLSANDSSRLTPGKRYKVSEILKAQYVVVEGYNHPGGGLYWTEFDKD